MGFPGSLYQLPFTSSTGKESTCRAGDPGSISGSGKSPGGGIGLHTPVFLGFPGGSDSKESAYNTGDLGSIPGLGRSPGGGHGNPLQYSCLENPMSRGSCRGTVPGVTELDTTEWLSSIVLGNTWVTYACTFLLADIKFFFDLYFKKMWTIFKVPYWICCNIASGFLATMRMGS